MAGIFSLLEAIAKHLKEGAKRLKERRMQGELVEERKIFSRSKLIIERLMRKWFLR
jgi:hypothetical protein